MKAWIENNQVRDVAQGIPQDIYAPAIAVLYDTDVPDGTVNGATLVAGVWTNPPPPPPAPPYVPSPAPPELRHVTNLAFRNRFTPTEKVDLEIASLDDPTATMAARKQAAGLRVALKDQESASYIDLDRDDTRAGVEMLEAAGLIAAGRAAIVLDAQVTEVERYRG
ncbi:hypothetical protein [Polaromonas sp.]|uniref:hypothetical protein n=1 Tax=Polaromonas sp. TaxID=1869339 RepID=UPI0035630135